ncbi:hypothetical protein [Pseudomonas sp. TNT2022 ID642]|uniref:hypothetical protein n=1 Tax=Pseudomonas sp. TNT2022 ID642 TaxID=2942632 RepID=UPI00235DD04D|nr:hypothetical protein [Pseudomonas sp. TNT2022 ID642]MDD1000974.1 hypothetical protein [Pseudomonas sp. TNT2022 ID642]
MASNKTLEVIGFSSIRESFLLFLLIGFLFMFFGGFVIDFEKDLPKAYETFLTEPVAMNIFFWMSLCGLGLTALIAAVKGRAFLQRKVVTHYSLALSRTGLVAGAIIVGLFFGLAFAFLFLSFFPGHENVRQYSEQFFPLALQMFMFLSLLVIAHLYLLMPSGVAGAKFNLLVLVLSSIFILLSLAGLVWGLDRQLFEIGLLCGVMQLVAQVMHRVSATNKQRGSTCP